MELNCQFHISILPRFLEKKIVKLKYPKLQVWHSDDFGSINYAHFEKSFTSPKLKLFAEFYNSTNLRDSEKIQ